MNLDEGERSLSPPAKDNKSYQTKDKILRNYADSVANLNGPIKINSDMNVGQGLNDSAQDLEKPQHDTRIISEADLV